MQLSQSIRLKQKQSMVMTPRLQQAIRMLQMNNLDLASYLEDQALENPFLEVSTNAGEASGTAADPDAAADATPNDAAPAEAIDTDMKAGASPQDDPGAQQDFDNRFDYSNADGPAGRQTGQGGDQDWDMIAATIAERPPSLFEHVGGQIDMAFDEPKERMIANILLGAVLPSGWLGKPVDDIAEENDLSRDAVARVLTRMQKFEPTGIFATGLADCLRLQAREAGVLTASFDILLDNLELLAQGKIDQLARRCKATPDDVRAMLRLIRQFDPKPAETFFGEVEIVSAPDLIAYRGPDGWVVELNKSTLPGITIDEHYAARLKKRVAEQAEQKFTMQALSSARWLKRAMEQRNETTLSIAAEIVRQQTPFLEKGANHLKPLLLRDVAKAVGMHESTVSRVTTGLMIATPRGSVTLKSFFSVSLASDDNEAGTSAASVRHLISEIIAKEKPGDPFSDDEIVTRINASGVAVARRTVAKYRQILKIPSSAERRRRARLNAPA